MTKTELWAERIARMEASGLSGPAFAAQEGVNANTLQWWRRELRIKAEEASTPPVARELHFVEVALTAPAAATGFVVQLAGCGHRIEVPPGFDGSSFRRLVEALC